MKHVLLFGGTFDPPHVGHLLMAQLAVEQTGIDEVWLLPAPLPPHKVAQAHLPYPLRLAMTEALIRGKANLRVSTIEASLSGPSYTVDTVQECQKQYPDHQFRFLIGSDSLADLPTWHEAKKLSKLVTFVIAARSSHFIDETLSQTLRELPELRIQVLEMPLLDVSSSWLRTRLEAGKPVCGLVPDGVLQIWQTHFSGRL